MQGSKDRGLLERLVGDWSEFNHSLHVGLVTHNHWKNPKLYGAVNLFLEAFDQVGTGVKQIIYYQGKEKEKVRGQLQYFVFYNIKDKSIFWSGQAEFLSFVVGFKSKPFLFHKESISEYVKKAKDLKHLSKNMILGMYYDPNVLGRWSFGLEVHPLSKEVQVSLFYKG